MGKVQIEGEGTSNKANPDNDETQSGQFLAALYTGGNKDNWVVQHRIPRGSRGGGGSGRTFDIAVFKGDPAAESEWLKIDVYTPRANTSLQGIKEFIHGKIKNQADIVCVNLEHISSNTAQGLANNIVALANQNHSRDAKHIAGGKVIVHRGMNRLAMSTKAGNSMQIA